MSQDVISGVVAIEAEAGKILEDARKKVREIAEEVRPEIDRLEAALNAELARQFAEMEKRTRAEIEAELAERNTEHGKHLEKVERQGTAGLSDAVAKIIAAL